MGTPLTGPSRKGAWREHPDFHLIAGLIPEGATSKSKIAPDCTAGCGNHYEVRIDHWLSGVARQHNACAQGHGKFRSHPDFHLIAELVSDEATSQTKITLDCAAGCGVPYEVVINSWLRGSRQHNACAQGHGKFRSHPDFHLIASLVKTGATVDTKITLDCAAGCGNPYEVAIGQWLKGHRQHCTCANNHGKFRSHPDFHLIASLVPEGATSNTKIALDCAAGCDNPYEVTIHNWLKGKRQHLACAHGWLAPRLAAEAPTIAAALPHLSAACDYMILWCIYGQKSPGMFRALRRGLSALQKGGSDDAFVQAAVGAASGEDAEAAQPEEAELADAEGVDDSADTEGAFATPRTPQQLRDQTERLVRASEALPPSADATVYAFLHGTVVAQRWAAYAAAESAERLGQKPALGTSALVEDARQLATHPSRLLREAYSEWCRQHDGAAGLKVGLRPRKNGKLVVPSMMQRLVAFLLGERPWLGNWSAPGAGKTLAALLAAKHLRSKLTLIVCPLNVIPSWEAEIARCYATSPRSGMAEKVTWAPDPDSEFLVWNYDMLQGLDVAARIDAFCAEYGDKVGLVVVDECHRAKNDGSIGQADESRRRAALEHLRRRLAQAKWLVQSGTPVITGVNEGASLLRLLTGGTEDVEGKYQLRRTDVGSALRMHAALVAHGVRFKPDYGCRVEEPRLASRPDGPFLDAKTGRRLDVAGAILVELGKEARAAVRNLGRSDWLGVDDAQLDDKLAAVVHDIQPQTVIYTHSVGRRGEDSDIVDRVAAYVRGLGLSVGVYDGRPESKKPSRLVWAELRRLGFVESAGKPCRRSVDLARYKRRELDVLVCSATLGEGVDGLHEVGHRLIVLSPPWTDGAYEQLVARWARQGQASGVVNVIVPVAYWRRPDGLFGSLDVARLEKIRHRRDVSRAALDGVIPESRGYSTKALRERVEAELAALRAGK